MQQKKTRLMAVLLCAAPLLGACAETKMVRGENGHVSVSLTQPTGVLYLQDRETVKNFRCAPQCIPEKEGGGQ